MVKTVNSMFFTIIKKKFKNTSVKIELLYTALKKTGSHNYLCWRRKQATQSNTLAWRTPMDRGAWQATVHGVLKSRTQLND